MLSSSSASSPPPWDLILLLVSPHLDPKTLARATCVSKSWRSSASSDFIWSPICFSHYPSLSSLRPTTTNTNMTIPYHRLYSLAHTSSQLRRSRLTPLKPSISLDRLVFAVDVFDPTATADHHRVLMTLVVDGRRLMSGSSSHDGVFRFDVDVESGSGTGSGSGGGWSEEVMRVRWSVVLKEWSGVFVVMDCVGRLGKERGSRRWFTEELPTPPGCVCPCVGGGGGGGCGLVGELGLIGMSGGGGGGGGEEMRELEKVSVGLMSVVCWRYVSVDDGLRYLQHFLLPSSAPPPPRVSSSVS